MDLHHYYEKLGIDTLFQPFYEIIEFNDLLMMILLLLLLLILVSLVSIRRRTRLLVDTNRKMLYELNQLNANLPRAASFFDEKTDPMM